MKKAIMQSTGEHISVSWCAVEKYRACTTFLENEEERKPFQCERCDFRTGYDITLKRHMRTHLGKQSAHFLKLIYFFSSQQSFSAPDDPSLVKFQCDTCNKNLHSKTALRDHMKLHLGENYNTLLLGMSNRLRFIRSLSLSSPLTRSDAPLYLPLGKRVRIIRALREELANSSHPSECSRLFPPPPPLPISQGQRSALKGEGKERGGEWEEGEMRIISRDCELFALSHPLTSRDRF